jgi:hypothetical protein
MMLSAPLIEGKTHNSDQSDFAPPLAVVRSKSFQRWSLEPLR